MADNKATRGPGDRRTVAGGEGYDVRYSARKHEIGATGADMLIARIDNDRAKLNPVAQELTTS